MILFFTNFFFAVLFTVLAVDEIKWHCRTGVVMFYLMIAGMSWYSCVVSIVILDAEPAKATVEKFLTI
jgi:hypothetical protein